MRSASRCTLSTAIVIVIVAFAPLARTQSTGTVAADDARRAVQKELAATIDRALAAEWSSRSIVPAAPADDACWLRRLSLDLLGEIPTGDEVAEFLADASDGKRDRKIDAYLDDPRLADHFARLWSGRLASSAGKDAAKFRDWLTPWLRERLAARAPFAEVVRHLLTDAGATQTPRSTVFILAYRHSIETLAGVTAREFLGLQLQCAQCHDHPSDRWTREQFNGFASFFAETWGDRGPAAETGGRPAYRVLDRSIPAALIDGLRKLSRRSRHEIERADGDAFDDRAANGVAGIADPAAVDELLELCAIGSDGSREIDRVVAAPARVVALGRRLPHEAVDLLLEYGERSTTFSVPRHLDGAPRDEQPRRTRRGELADWILAPRNPWFGRAIANRTWSQLFGRGLIEPVDDLSGSRDRVLPELLEAIGRAFVDQGTDLRLLIGAMTRTSAYAAGSCASGDDAARSRAERWFAAHPRRPLTIEQLATILAALDRGPIAGADAAAIRDFLAARDRLVDRLEQSVPSDDASREQGAPLSAQLAWVLMDGGIVRTPAVLRERRLLDLIRDARLPASARVAPLFRATLGRPPAEGEADQLLALLPAADRLDTAAFDDLCWALVNSTEFRMNP